MTDFDFELLAEIASEAPVAGGNFSYTNYGRTWMDNLQVSAWNNDSKSFDKEPYTGGQIPAGSTLEFQLHQEIEKQDGDSFTKTWYLQVKESGKRAKDKTDWGEIIKPSAVSVFKGLGQFFKAMSGDGSYCAIEDYLTGRTRESKTTGQVFDVTAPKFLEVFKSKKACQQAKEAKFASAALNGKIPDTVVKKFKAFVNSLGGLEDALENLEDDYEGFPINDVVKASGLKK